MKNIGFSKRFIFSFISPRSIYFDTHHTIVGWVAPKSYLLLSAEPLKNWVRRLLKCPKIGCAKDGLSLFVPWKVGARIPTLGTWFAWLESSAFQVRSITRIGEPHCYRACVHSVSGAWALDCVCTSSGARKRYTDNEKRITRICGHHVMHCDESVQSFQYTNKDRYSYKYNRAYCYL